MQAEQKKSVQDIIELFDIAEDKVKEIEQLNHEISIPSINELRYVGYHLARLFCEDDSQEIELQIAKAKSHCQRAIYDAHEIGIIYMLEKIKLFKEQYMTFSHLVIEVLPNYIEILKKANQAARFIAGIKENHRNNRHSYYQECEPHYSVLRDSLDELMVAELLIQQKIIEYRIKDRKQSRNFIITVVLSLMAIVVAALKLLA